MSQPSLWRQLTEKVVDTYHFELLKYHGKCITENCLFYDKLPRCYIVYLYNEALLSVIKIVIEDEEFS